MSSAPASQHVIAYNTREGQSSWYNRSKEPQNVASPYGHTCHVYTSPEVPSDVSYNATSDFETTLEHSQTGIATMNGRICPDNGLSTAILVLNPGAVTVMHRTRTLDTGVILEGEVEIRLDDGGVRTLKVGDTFVFRGANHQWANLGDKPCKFFAVVVDAKKIVGANGEEVVENRF